jgi:peptidoglycan hydrolase CwlO-like protein
MTGQKWLFAGIEDQISELNRKLGELQKSLSADVSDLESLPYYKLDDCRANIEDDRQEIDETLKQISELENDRASWIINSICRA